MALVERAMGRWAGGYLLPGSGDFLSAGRALGKEEALRQVQQHFFHDGSAYKGGDIALNDVLQAIKYARSKKLTKAHRKGVIGGVKLASFVAGAASGATLGSVIPVAGTVAGGAVGGVGLATIASGGVFALDHLKRKTKGLFKMIRGTRGEHRHQAARAFLYCQGFFNPQDPKQRAAEAALTIILDGEYKEVMAMELEPMVERLADRLKSN